MVLVARGDIVLVAGGGYASKPGPALVIQDDLFSGTDSVTVVPFTTTDVEAPLLRLKIPAAPENGLGQDSSLMVDKVTTVHRSNVGPTLGRLNETQMLELERLLITFFGIGR